jgi:succinate dehydrogenase / fumarate reductase, membrane anchor subunit
MVKRVVTGAHYGLKDWLAQRVTASVMAVYAIAFAAMLLICPPQQYDDWRALFSNQFVRAATFVFLVSLFWHAWIGARNILMDYIKPTGVRLLMHVLAVLALFGYAGWAIQILWSL